MKTTIVTGLVTASILLTGCGKQSSPSGGPPAPANEQTGPASAAGPVAQPAMTAWQQGDKPAAIKSFVEADWSARPLFAPGSVLNLSEDQFKALSSADRQAKASEINAQLGALKRLSAEVAQAGRDAAAKGDPAQARQHFMSLKQCGAALDRPDCLLMVQLVGKALKKMADTELAKVGQ